MASEYGDDAKIDGAVTINESSADKDTRIESDDNTHMFFVDASTDRVGIGTDSPTATLHAYASVSDAYVTLIDNDAASNSHGLKVTSDGTGTGTILLDVEAASTTVFKIRGDGRVGIGVATPGSTLSVDDEIAVGEKLLHRGDSDTYLQFPGQNQMNLTANGHAFLTYDGTIKINNAARDRDTQILADDGNAVIHVDAGDNRVGVGTASPACLLHVDGAAQFTTAKLNDATWGGVTRNTSGVSSVTLPLPNNTSAYVDTTISIPANSVVRYIFIKKTTPGVNSNGTLYISNFAMRYGGTTPDSDYDEYYSDWDYPGGSSKENGYNLEGASGDPDYTGHYVINGIVDGRSGRAAYNYARDLWLKITSTGDASGGTAPVVSVLAVYDTFDIS